MLRPVTERRCGWLRSSALGLVVAGGLLAAACGSSGQPPSATSQASPAPAAGIRGVQVSPPVAEPDIVLSDTSGKPFSLRKDTAGDLTLLYLGYTNCPDVCPTTMSDFANAMKLLSPEVASHVKMVFVTTDPERDTPGVMRKWLDHFNTQFIGLTGTQDQLNQLQDDLLMPRAQKESDGKGGYGVSHAAFTFAFTPNDQTAHTIYPEGFTKEDLAHDISLLVNGWKGPTG